MFLFVWGPWVTSDSLKRCDWRWGIWVTWYRLNLQRDWRLRSVTRESTMPMWQRPNKTLDPEAGVHCPGWQYSECWSYTTWKGSPVPTATGRGRLEALCLELSWMPPDAPLPFADLHLYSSVVINHQSNHSHWVPWGLLMNYWTWEIWRTRKLEAGVAIVEVRVVLWTPAPSCYRIRYCGHRIRGQWAGPRGKRECVGPIAWGPFPWEREAR